MNGAASDVSSDPWMPDERRDTRWQRGGWMLLQAGLFCVGLVGLYFGAQWLVRGAARLARSCGVGPLVVGLTIVAFGTSAPSWW
jgi:hypothetical protein